MAADFIGFDYTKLLGIDYAKFASVDYSKLANIDFSKFTKIDFTKTLASVDFSKTFANLDYTKIEFNHALANIDFSKLAKIDRSQFENLDFTLFADATRFAGSLAVADDILHSQAIADTIVSTTITEEDIEGIDLDDAPAAPDPIADTADPLGLFIPTRDLSGGEWAFLAVLVERITDLATTNYNQTAEQAFAVTVIAFILLRAIISRSPRFF